MQTPLKTAINGALLTFIDFIYALVFAFIVQRSFDEIILKDELPIEDKIARLLLLGAIFYLLAWDWILGRILTYRNPYQSYTSFFFEILIAICGYGMATTAVKGFALLILCFAVMMLFGVAWARQTNRHRVHSKDARELCIIQSLQFIAGFVAATLFVSWRILVGKMISIPLAVAMIVFIFTLIFFYESVVPRYRGVSAGPGFPFVARSDIRTFSRWCSRNLDNI